MNCPDCGGRGFVFRLPSGVNAFLLRIEQIERLTRRLPCPNSDCHAGQVHCCDGVRAQPEPARREGEE